MSITWFISSLVITAAFAGHGLRKQSLSLAGALTALVIGTIQMYCGPRFGITLLVFYFTSSQLTKYKTNLKAVVEENYKKNGQRSPLQVLTNALGGCVCALLAKHYENQDHRLMDWALVAFMGHYACCCADTWSSELGILSDEPPVLILNGQVVPKGTNGGVSRLGTMAGAAGGLLVGAVFWATGALDSTRNGSGLSVSLLPLGLTLGLLGTFLDSILGALFQYTGYSSKLGRVVGRPGEDVVHLSGRQWLSNESVNFISANITAMLGACVVAYGKSNYPYRK